MIDKEAILKVIQILKEERRIEPDITIEALKEGLTRAYHRDVDPQADVIIDIDKNTGDVHLYNNKEVVAEITDDMTQLTLEQAQKLDKNLKIGDFYKDEFEIETKFSRIAMQQVAQTLKQKLREVEKNIIFEEYKDKIGHVVSARVESESKAGFILTIGTTPAFLPKSQTIQGETLSFDHNISVCVTDVTHDSKGAPLLVSRTHVNLVRSLMIESIPEIADGLIEIVWIERMAGRKTKVVVKSLEASIEPIGTCVGRGGERIKNIERYLSGEKIEIAKMCENEIDTLKSIFSPADLISVEIQDELINIVIPDEKYSLALATGGLNVKLAAVIFNKKIKLYKLSEIAELGIQNLDNTGYGAPDINPRKDMNHAMQTNIVEEEISKADFKFTDVEESTFNDTFTEQDFSFEEDDAFDDPGIDYNDSADDMYDDEDY